MKIWKIKDDSEVSLVFASSKDDALQVLRENGYEPDGTESVSEVSEEEAKEWRVFDEDANKRITLLAIFRRDSSRQLAASTCW